MGEVNLKLVGLNGRHRYTSLRGKNSFLTTRVAPRLLTVVSGNISGGDFFIQKASRQGVRRRELYIMKKILTSMIAIMLIFSLTGCGGNANKDVNSVDKIKEKGELVLLTEATFPPFEYASTEEGSVDGIAGVDIEFGKALADKLGVKLKVMDLNFDTLTVALQSDKGDIIAAGMTENPDRAKVVDFSKTYFDNGLFIIVKKDSDIKTKDDLEGKKIAVQQGTTGNDYSDKVKDANVLTFKGMVEAGLAVKNGNADASVMDVLTAKIIVNKNPELMILDTPVESEKTAIAVQKGNESLLKVVNELLDELQAEGKLEQWFDDHYNSLVD